MRRWIPSRLGALVAFVLALSGHARAATPRWIPLGPAPVFLVDPKRDRGIGFGSGWLWDVRGFPVPSWTPLPVAGGFFSKTVYNRARDRIWAFVPGFQFTPARLDPVRDCIMKVVVAP
jgi:hypothetical protein